MQNSHNYQEFTYHHFQQSNRTTVSYSHQLPACQLYNEVKSDKHVSTGTCL